MYTDHPLLSRVRVYVVRGFTAVLFISLFLLTVFVSLWNTFFLYLIVSGQVCSLEGKLPENLEILFACLAGPPGDAGLSPTLGWQVEVGGSG